MTNAFENDAPDCMVCPCPDPAEWVNHTATADLTYCDAHAELERAMSSNPGDWSLISAHSQASEFSD